MSVKPRLDRYTDQQRKRILDNMELFQLETVKPIIFWGTLLGAIREQRFIGHDDDIDFGYISKYNKVEDVRNELYEVYQELNKKGWLKKIFMRGGAVYKLPPKKEFKGFGQCHVSVNGSYFDLFTLWFDESGELQSYPFINLGKNYLPLEKYQLYDRDFYSIGNGKKFLKRVYGSDWQIPQAKKTSEKHHWIL